MANIIQINGKKVKDVNAARMSSLAPVESSTTASMAHAVGDYFWLNGTLYEATAAITIGNAISVGTNCKITNMGENLADLKSQTSILKEKSCIVVESNTTGDLSAYYLPISELNTTKTYALSFTVLDNGLYTVQTGTAGSASAMVDTLVTDVSITANTQFMIYGYKPSTNGIIRIRLYNMVGGTMSSTKWSVVVNEIFDANVAATDFNAVKDQSDTDSVLLNNVARKTIEDNNLYSPDDPGIETGGIYLYNGSWYASSDYFETGYIPVPGGSTVYFSATSAAHANWYSADKTRLNGATSTSQSATLQKVTVGSTAAYIRLGLSNTYMSSAYVGTSPDHIVTIEYKIKDSALPDNHWNGKKWYAFGTSLTDGTSINAETGEVVGKYASILAQMSGMTLINNGVAGGTFANQILNKVTTTDVSDADLITIEGCVNDFASGTDIGEYGDYTATTIYGAMYLMAKYCSEHSNALVVFITDSTGKIYTSPISGTTSDMRFIYKKGNGLTQGDYNKAIKDCAAYMGCPCIDAGGDSSINFFHPDYIVDQIHHTDLGGEQYAKTIWAKLKNIAPILVD